MNKQKVIENATCTRVAKKAGDLSCFKWGHESVHQCEWVQAPGIEVGDKGRLEWRAGGTFGYYIFVKESDGTR